MGGINDYTISGSSSPSRNTFIHCLFQTSGNGGLYETTPAYGAQLTGTAGNGNTCLNTFIACTCVTANAIPWKLENSDDDAFFWCGGQPNKGPSSVANGLHIIGITNANPAVVTYSSTDSHPTNDWQLWIDGAYGMTQVNRHVYKIKNVNTGARTFELYKENGTTPVNSISWGTFVGGPRALNDVATTTECLGNPETPGMEFGSQDQDSITTNPGGAKGAARVHFIYGSGAFMRVRAVQHATLANGGPDDNVGPARDIIALGTSRANGQYPSQIELAVAGGGDDATLHYLDTFGVLQVGTIKAADGIRCYTTYPASPTLFWTGSRNPPIATDGFDKTPDPAEMYVAEIWIPANCLTNGIQLLNGSLVAGSFKAAIYDVYGIRRRQIASTAQAGAAILQQVPWSGSTVVELKGPGTYFLTCMFSVSGSRFRAHTFGGFKAGLIGGLTFTGGPPDTIALPTGFIAQVGPIMGLY
jgi:hypothetical protein